MKKFFKILFGFIFGLILFILLIVIFVTIMVTGGKNFDVNKETAEVDAVVSESLYDAFVEQSGNSLDIKISSSDLSKIFNNVLLDINSDYQDEDVLLKSGPAVVQKAKIEVSGSTVIISARAKVGPLKTTAVLKGKPSYNSTDETLVIDFTSAKVGRTKLNPTKILKNVTGTSYIKNGKFVYPINLSSKVGDGIAKTIVDNCPLEFKSQDDNLILSFDVSKIVDNDDHTSSYVAGTLQSEALAQISATTTSITISKDTFNGYICTEYTHFPTLDMDLVIVDQEYSVVDRHFLQFDENVLYYGMKIEGMNTSLNMECNVAYNAGYIEFNVGNKYLGEILLANELNDITNVLLSDNKLKINGSDIETVFSSGSYNVSITSVNVDSNSNFIFGVSVS